MEPILALWAITAAMEVALVSLLIYRDAPVWFTVWMSATMISSLTGMSMRNAGHAYADLWQVKQIILMVILAMSVAEIAKSMWIKKYSYAMPIAIAAMVHVILRIPYQWPNSTLETVYAVIAYIQLALGLFMAQCWAKSKGSANAVIMATYLLATATCYYAAPAFNRTIGIAVMWIELLAVMAWSVVFSRDIPS